MLLPGGTASCEKGDEDARKLQFTLAALASRDPFALEAAAVCLHVESWRPCAHAQADVSSDLEHALRWQAERSPEEVVSLREATMQALEAAGAEMWEKGWCEDWLKGADASVAKVSATVNGPMLQDLCRAVGYGDSECVNMFREGSIENSVLA